MTESIIHSAPPESIAQYLKRINGYGMDQARAEAEQVIADFHKMERMGYIRGWYFDEHGHLELLPSDDALSRLDESVG